MSYQDGLAPLNRSCISQYLGRSEIVGWVGWSGHCWSEHYVGLDSSVNPPTSMSQQDGLAGLTTLASIVVPSPSRM